MGACGADPPPATPAAEASSPRACPDAYQDLSLYFDSPDHPRPPTFKQEPFLAACRDLPAEAQRCLLFSYMQAHTKQCEEANAKVDPALMKRVATIAGK